MKPCCHIFFKHNYKLKAIDIDSLSGSAAKKVCKKVAEMTFKDESVRLYIQGRDAYNGENEYAGAQDYDKAKELNETLLPHLL